MPLRPRRQPQRSCVACRSKRPKAELVRLVLDAEGGLRIDARGRAPGRGAYLCAETDCWRRAARGRTLGAALRHELGDGARALLDAGPPADRVDRPDAGARYASAGETTP
jgi:hypothetical protein